MKRKIFLMAALVAGLGLASCSVDTSGLEDAVDDLEEQMDEAADKMDEEMEEMEEDADTETESMSTVMYQCPDDCENGPAYFDPGPCKKCGKDMVEI